MKFTLVLIACVTCAACSGPGEDGPKDAEDTLRPDGDNDTDLDGVKDDVDNCVTVTNGFQGNEDGDRFGDACDPCPPLAGNDPIDTDGDGVANDCDPVPFMFGDRVAFFEGFHQGVPQGWDKVGTWSTNADQLVGSTAGTGHFALIVTDRTRETITASVQVTSVAGTTSEVGVLDNKLGNNTSAIACVATGMSEISLYDTANAAGAMKATYELTPGQTYLIKLRRDNSTYTCTADRAGTMASVTKQLTLFNTPYLSGLTIRGAAVRVNWFMVVESL